MGSPSSLKCYNNSAPGRSLVGEETVGFPDEVLEVLKKRKKVAVKKSSLRGPCTVSNGCCEPLTGRLYLHNHICNFPMPPIPSSPSSRIVIYYQTQHNPDGTPCSILPVITNSNIAVTHVNVAALHLNDPPGHITLVSVVSNNFYTLGRS